MLAAPSIAVIVVAHKDRAPRCGFRLLQTLLEQQGRRVAVVQRAEQEREDLQDLMADLVAIVCSFCARRSGKRRAKRKTEAIVRALTREEARVADEREWEEVVEDATG